MKTTHKIDIRASDRLQPFWAVVIVFFSNFCILVLELAAGRIMAPVFADSGL